MDLDLDFPNETPKPSRDRSLTLAEYAAFLDFCLSIVVEREQQRANRPLPASVPFAI